MTAREPELDIDEPPCDEHFESERECFRPNVSHLCTVPDGHGGSHECGDCGAHETDCDCADCVTRAGERQDEAVREWNDEHGIPNLRRA